MLVCVLLCVYSCVNTSVAIATNLAINSDLLDEALSLGGMRTKKDTVNQALTEFVQRRKQREIAELFGSLPFDEDYDYKKARR